MNERVCIIYTDENKRWPVIVADIAIKYKAVKAMLDEMIAQVGTDASLTITPEIAKALAIKSRKVQHHHTRSTIMPKAEIVHTQAGEVTVVLTNTQDNNVKHSRPKDVDRIGRAVVFIDHGAPTPAHGEFINLDDVRGTRFTLTVPRHPSPSRTPNHLVAQLRRRSRPRK